MCVRNEMCGCVSDGALDDGVQEVIGTVPLVLGDSELCRRTRYVLCCIA